MHTKFLLVVKGDLAATTQALSKRGMVAGVMVKHPEFNEVVVHVDDVPLETLTQWFHMTPWQGAAPWDKAPYPDGTLLWYGPRHGE